MKVIACSACRRVQAAGSKFCRGCGLPLTAHALPVTVRPRPIVGIAIGIFALAVRL
jgi:hypothetical protein